MFLVKLRNCRQTFVNTVSLAASLVLPYSCLVCGKRLWNGVLCCFCRPDVFEGTPLFKRCPLCFTESQHGGLCLLCRLIPLPFASIRYTWRYHGKARRLIAAMKYRPSRALCREAGGSLTKALPHLGITLDHDLIIPMPSSPRSLARRGFNQCRVLAGPLVETLCKKRIFRDDVLENLGSRCAQASLPHSRRLTNVGRSFRADGRLVAGRRVLLIEDVVTTGATSAAAAIALLQNGAHSVDLLALARADSWLEHRFAVYRYFRKNKQLPGSRGIKGSQYVP